MQRDLPHPISSFAHLLQLWAPTECFKITLQGTSRYGSRNPLKCFQNTFILNGGCFENSPWTIHYVWQPKFCSNLFGFHGTFTRRHVKRHRQKCIHRNDLYCHKLMLTSLLLDIPMLTLCVISGHSREKARGIREGIGGPPGTSCLFASTAIGTPTRSGSYTGRNDDVKTNWQHVS